MFTVHLKPLNIFLFYTLRWSNEALKLSQSLENVIGDVLIAAAVVAYLGAFTVEYREVIILVVEKYSSECLSS